MTPEEMRAIEPTLAGSYYGGFFTESDATGDIHKYTNGLAKAAAKRGVRLNYGHQVTDLGADENSAWVSASIDGEEIRQSFDSVVVCAGVGSRAVAAKLGDRVNIYPVKGYSITVQLDDEASQQAAPTVSLLDDETKLVTSRLGNDRFRVAGTAEFNGANRDIRNDRIQPLVRWVEQCFPGVSTASGALGGPAPNAAEYAAQSRPRQIADGVLQHGPRPPAGRSPPSPPKCSRMRWITPPPPLSPPPAR